MSNIITVGLDGYANSMESFKRPTLQITGFDGNQTPEALTIDVLQGAKPYVASLESLAANFDALESLALMGETISEISSEGLSLDTVAVQFMHIALNAQLKDTNINVITPSVESYRENSYRATEVGLEGIFDAVKSVISSVKRSLADLVDKAKGVIKSFMPLIDRMEKRAKAALENISAPTTEEVKGKYLNKLLVNGDVASSSDISKTTSYMKDVFEDLTGDRGFNEFIDVINGGVRRLTDSVDFSSAELRTKKRDIFWSFIKLMFMVSASRNLNAAGKAVAYAKASTDSFMRALYINESRFVGSIGVKAAGTASLLKWWRDESRESRFKFNSDVLPELGRIFPVAAGEKIESVYDDDDDLEYVYLGSREMFSGHRIIAASYRPEMRVETKFLLPDIWVGVKDKNAKVDKAEALDENGQRIALESALELIGLIRDHYNGYVSRMGKYRDAMASMTEGFGALSNKLTQEGGVLQRMNLRSACLKIPVIYGKAGFNCLFRAQDEMAGYCKGVADALISYAVASQPSGKAKKSEDDAPAIESFDW